MRTNFEKWDFCKAEIEKRDDAFIAEQLDEVPKAIYSVAPRGQIEVRHVEKVSYRHLHATWFSGKKPTNKDVEKISTYLANMLLVRGEILFYWKSGQSSGATSVKNIEEYADLTTSKEEADSMSVANKAKAEHEDELLKNGHFRCAYCSKVTPDTQAVPCTIHNFKMYGRAGKQNRYCSGTCGLHDQYAHEG